MYKEVAKFILYRDLGENSILRKLAGIFEDYEKDQCSAAELTTRIYEQMKACLLYTSRCVIRDSLYDLLLCFSLQYKNEHERAVTEKEGQKNLVTIITSTFHGIHFNNGDIRICLNKLLKIVISTAYTELPGSQTYSCSGFSWLAFISDFSAQIHISGSEYSLFDVGIKCFSGLLYTSYGQSLSVS